MNTLYEQNDMLISPYEAFYVNGSDFGDRVNAHWHYFVEIMYITQGNVRVNCDNKEYHLEAGDLILFHAGAIHTIFAPSKELRYSIIKLNLSSLHSSGSLFLNPAAIIRSARGDERAPIHLRQDEIRHLPIRDWFDRCIMELQNKDYGYDTCFYSNVSNLLLEIIRLWRKRGFPAEHTSPETENGTIQTITEYIDEHSNQPLRVEALAKMCGMSYSYFARSFRELYGRSCKDYIEFVRIRKAKDLLIYTDLDLNYISLETGFSDCSHFIRIFRQLEKTTPHQYRKSYQTNH